MKDLHFLLLLCFVCLFHRLADSVDTHGCAHEWSILWTKEIANSPFAAAPLIHDINNDGQLDIVAGPFTEEVTVLHANNGHILKDSKWPSHNVAGTLHSTPIQFDIDKDGGMEIMICTSDAEIFFYTSNGNVLPHKFKFPSIQSSFKHNHSLNNDLQPHILATPVLRDLNNDGTVEELTVSLSYYNSESKESSHVGVSRVAVLNLTALEIIWEKQLDIQVNNPSLPAYQLYPPTIADLEGTGGATLHIVTGSSAGQLHVLDHAGHEREGFPITVYSPIVTQVVVADVDKDEHLEILVCTQDGRVLCINTAGRTLWNVNLKSLPLPDMYVVDIDGDLIFEVVLATKDGNIWILKGTDGSVLPKWPIKIGSQMTTGLLLTQMTMGSLFDIVILSDDKYVHVISSDQKCRSALQLGETSLIPLLSHDLVLQSPGLELLVATQDGTLICIGRRHHFIFGSLWSAAFHPLMSDLDGLIYTSGKYGIKFYKKLYPLEISSSTFEIDLEIIDIYYISMGRRQYRVQAYIGAWLVFSDVLYRPGVHTVYAQCPDKPTTGLLSLQMISPWGQVYQDHTAIRCNIGVLEDLQWLVILPMLCLGAALLFLHGFVETELLPFSVRSKTI